MSGTNWRPWTVGIWSLAVGALLFLAGYFSIQLDDRVIPATLSKGLMALSGVCIAVHYGSGLNQLVWSIRSKFDAAERDRLKRLRLYGSLLGVPLLVGIGLPPASSIFRPPLGAIRHDELVMFCFVGTLIVLSAGGLNRAAEFRLLRSSSRRTGSLPISGEV